MSYRAIIADDEEELRSYLKSMLSDVWPELTICGEARNGAEAVEMADAMQPHVAFLDIKMPGVTGMDVAKSIARRCRIVFITAFDQYAVEAFEKGAVDYLLKPVSKERLSHTVERLKEQIDRSADPSPQLSEIIADVLATFEDKRSPGFLRWIRAQHKDSVRLIAVADIDYFKAEDKYTVVVTKDGESVIRKSIKELARELDQDQFWQIHRGTIVNVSKIDRFHRSFTGRGVVRLLGRSETLLVSRNFLHLFKQT
jgi:DNA-binding LytR/AlgR family response regulator